MTAVVLFTRDQRVRDQPVLAAACRDHDEVVPLFVVDDEILAAPTASPNRAAFLAESLAELRSALRDLGGDLVVRRGDVVVETLRIARQVNAHAVLATADVSAYAQRRQHRLAVEGDGAGLQVTLLPGVTVVPPGSLTPQGGGDHYRVFTPYFRAWQAAPRRSEEPVPDVVRLPAGVDVGRLPGPDDLVRGTRSRRLPTGGEPAGCRLLDDVARRLEGGEPDFQSLAGDHTSRLSPYLHLGCVSPLIAARRLSHSPHLVRQLAWRDFLHQVTVAFPAIATADYRPRASRWRRDDDALDAWRAGRTGIPIVDAGMRQLLDEGWMHNRARLITASFLTKTLQLDWRLGAAHFWRWLVDGDIANNAGNWQWVAGTGNATRPNRVLNPIRQAQRFDPEGDYVRRYVPELAAVSGRAVHEPWKLHSADRSRLDYPTPMTNGLSPAER